MGLNTTLNDVDWFGVRVTGVLAPLKVKPDPFSVIWETVTFAFPVFVIVTVCVDVEPVFTLPKERLVLLNESV